MSKNSLIKRSFYQRFCLLLALSFGLAQLSIAEILATSIGYYSQNGEKVTIECSLMGAGALRYPPKARKYKYVGEVIVGFSIGSDGKVVDPVILEAEPPGIFERSALKYVRSWRYAPPEHGGEQIQVDDVAVRIAFQPNR